ncbi:MAG: hypothetical protein HOW73_40465 [Polyangiaceae bacterium]|nr:hypothetical protein [Polyangiaceae bacterium]
MNAFGKPVVLLCLLSACNGASVPEREDIGRSQEAISIESPCQDPTDYGGDPTDGASDTSAFQQALANGDVCVPPGVWNVHGIIIPSGRRIYGYGGRGVPPSGGGGAGGGPTGYATGSESIIKYLPSQSYNIMFYGYDHTTSTPHERIEIDHLSFDLNGASGCGTVLALNAGSSHINVHDNSFTDSDYTQDSCDNWAISAGSVGYTSVDLRVERNRLSGPLQLTANGGHWTDVWIKDNIIEDAYNFGIALTGCHFSNVNITGNSISQSHGIAVGLDGGATYTGCEMQKINISENNLKVPGFVGIQTQGFEFNRQITIAGNHIFGDEESLGISVTAQSADRLYEDVSVANNHVNGAHFGIRAGQAERLTISGNHVVDANEGINVGDSNIVALQSNIVVGGSQGVTLTSVEDVLALGNSVVDVGNTTNNFETGVAITAAEARKTSGVVVANRMVDTRVGSARTQDWGIAQYGSGVFDVHYMHNDLSNNKDTGVLVSPNTLPVASWVDNIAGEGYQNGRAPARIIRFTHTPPLNYYGIGPGPSVQTITFQVVGVRIGDVVSVGADDGYTSISGMGPITGFVPADDYVTVQFERLSGTGSPFLNGPLQVEVSRHH